MRQGDPPGPDDACRVSRGRDEASLREHRTLFPLKGTGTVMRSRRKLPGSRPRDSQRGRPAGDAWLGRIERGQIFRIVDLEGNQAVDTLFYNAADPADRYSAADTIRAQGNIYLTTGTRLLSTDGQRCSPSSRTRAGGTTPSAAPAPPRATRCATATARSVDARLPRQLPAGRGAREASRHDEARHRQQHQLLHERPGDARRRAHLRRWHLRAAASTSSCAPRWTCSASSRNCPQLNNPCNAYNPTPIRVLVWDARP